MKEYSPRSAITHKMVSIRPSNHPQPLKGNSDGCKAVKSGVKIRDKRLLARCLLLASAVVIITFTLHTTHTPFNSGLLDVFMATRVIL